MTENKASILIKGGWLVTMNRQREIKQGDLLIEDGIIKAIGHFKGPARLTIDASEMIVLPGFIQTHVHLCQVLFRGLADDVDVVDWLKHRIWPLENAHDEESIYCSAWLGIAELLAGGTTTILAMETTRHTDAVFQALLESGMRAVAGNAMMDVQEPGTEMEGQDSRTVLAESKRLWRSWHGRDNGRLQYALTPRGPRNCSPELLSEIARLSAEEGLLVHSHAAENGPLAERVARETGVRDVVLFHRLGLASPRLVLAHCIWLDEQELELAASTGIKVTHCPSANLKLSSGFAKIPEMRSRGINVSLGADGAPCNNNLDMFNEMRLAALIHKPRCGPRTLPAEEVLEMATLGGARALGLEKEIGSLEVGKKADVTLVRRDRFHSSPWQRVPLPSQIVYSLKAGDVDTTLVEGRILYRHGRLTMRAGNDIVEAANTAIERVLERVPFGREFGRQPGSRIWSSERGV
ncbi:5'-deoxyadenosine deaminase [Neomoorella glycerini]|uniref:5'-deoxyadenosine deaminase n=1 Tax=Neomoorella glycerini TaxID=55779 RepID=UPI001FE54998|nr:5'-deoxyadenosine deaminase [Moorella glycerini]